MRQRGGRPAERAGGPLTRTDAAIAYLSEHEDAEHTRSLVERRIRVNAVAPGPVWTPLIPATMPEEKVEKFGQQVPMERAAHPDEIAP